MRLTQFFQYPPIKSSLSCKQKNYIVQYFLKGQLERIRAFIMISNRFSENCIKKQVIAIFFETSEKPKEKEKILKPKNPVIYKMPKLTVGHQKETTDHMMRDQKVLQNYNFKASDNLLERQAMSKSKNRVNSPLKIYHLKAKPRFVKQSFIFDGISKKYIAADTNILIFICNNNRYFQCR